MSAAHACLVLPLTFPEGVAPGHGRHGNRLLLTRDGQDRLILRGTALAGVLRHAYAKHHGKLDDLKVQGVMNAKPLTCNMETEIDEVRRMMLVDHARYLPVIDQKMLMGVISFYDVAKSVVEAQDFENSMLKAYIRDWPEEAEKASP